MWKGEGNYVRMCMFLVDIFPFYGLEGLRPGNLPGISNVQETICLWRGS